MPSQSQATRLATTQTLTASYVITSTMGNFQVLGETALTFDIEYTTGVAETGTALAYILEFSPDFDANSPSTATWIQECSQSFSGTTATETPLDHKIVGGAGATVYPGEYCLPVCSRAFRIRVKETGVSSNFGTVSVWVTTNSANIANRNLIPPAGGGGTTDVNLKQVAGSNVATAATGIAKVGLTDGSGNDISSTASALDINIKSGNPTSITANAGSNLNTSALALESGGNLAKVVLPVDQTYNVEKVQVQATPGTVLTASGQVKGSAGQLMGYVVNSFTTGATVKVWNNTAASGTVVFDTQTFTTQLAPFVFCVPAVLMTTGIYFTLSGTISITPLYN